jgi:hypothetical protein
MADPYTPPPRSTVDNLREAGNDIDRQIEGAPAPTGAPIARDPPQPIQARVNPDNRMAPQTGGTWDTIKSVFTGGNPQVQ